MYLVFLKLRNMPQKGNLYNKIPQLNRCVFRWCGFATPDSNHMVRIENEALKCGYGTGEISYFYCYTSGHEQGQEKPLWKKGHAKPHFFPTAFLSPLCNSLFFGLKQERIKPPGVLGVQRSSWCLDNTTLMDFSSVLSAWQQINKYN